MWECFLSHVQALTNSFRQKQNSLSVSDAGLAHLSEAWARIILPPFLLFEIMQQLAPWDSIEKVVQARLKILQTWSGQSVGCMLNYAGEEFSKVICVSLITSTDCAVSLANAKSFWKSPSIYGHKTSYSMLSLCANLLFAIGHSLLIAGLPNPIAIISGTGQHYKGNCHHLKT